MPKPRRHGFGRIGHCECHDIPQEEIDACIRAGAASVVAVFRMKNRKLKCGDCVPAIRKAIASRQSAS